MHYTQRDRETVVKSLIIDGNVKPIQCNRPLPLKQTTDGIRVHRGFCVDFCVVTVQGNRTGGFRWQLQVLLSSTDTKAPNHVWLSLILKVRRSLSEWWPGDVSQEPQQQIAKLEKLEFLGLQHGVCFPSVTDSLRSL